LDRFLRPSPASVFREAELLPSLAAFWRSNAVVFYSSDGLRDKRPIAHVQKVCYVPGGLRLCRPVRASSTCSAVWPHLRLLLFYLWPSFPQFTLAHHEGLTCSSLPPVGILRLAGNPDHEFQK
jgi:hypothetical protein